MEIFSPVRTKITTFLFAMAVIVLCFSITGFAQTQVQAIKIKTPPSIDGRLDEEIWQQASRITEFYQRQPDTGAPVSEPTEFYICYDEDNIYVGARCFIDPLDITAKEMARDVSLRYDDRIQIIFDTFLDGRNGYWFQVSPRGSIGDALISQNGAAFNKEWDGLWTGKARIVEDGWHAEVAIPLKTLSFRPGQDTWGIKFIRHIQKRNEAAYWPVANLDTYRFQVSDAAHWTNLDGLTQGIGLDLSPYVLTGNDHSVEADDEFVFDIGLDAFYQLTPGLKSALSLNTDFAQTEVDDRIINLTRFPLFFPEKRDFFLDGASYYQFGREGDRANPFANRLITFFSRRIGLDQDNNPIPMLGGAKITGQQGSWNFGILGALDDRDYGKESFFVSRISHNIGRQSYIGGIATYGNAESPANNNVVGLDMKLATSTFLQNKNLAIILFGLKSNTDSLKSDDRSFGAEVSYPNDFLSMRAGFTQIEKNYRAGVGFVPRNDIRNYYLSTMLGPRPRRWGILQAESGVTLDYVTNLNNELLTRDIELQLLGISLVSGDGAAFSITPLFEALDDTFAIRDDNLILPGDYDFTRYNLKGTSAQRRDFFVSGGYEWGSFWNGKRNDITLGIGYKISVPVLVELQYIRNNVSLDDGDFTTNVMQCRLDLLFNPDITLKSIFQYDNESQTFGWQSRFQWILKPGNEILFVWNSLWQDHMDRFQVSDSSTRLKLRYNYRF